MMQGSADAKVEIIEYASYTCPHCASFHAGPYKDLKKDYVDTGKVKFVYREVYFDRFGLWASMIARCAGTGSFLRHDGPAVQRAVTCGRARVILRRLLLSCARLV